MPPNEYELARLHKEMDHIIATISINRKIHPPDDAIRFNEIHIKRIEEIDDQISMMEGM